MKQKQEIMVLVRGSMEQWNLMKYLSNKGYHWLSGQNATDIPTFMEIKMNGWLIHVLSPKDKTIGIFPVSVYDSELERLQVLSRTVTVQDLDTSLL